jgi:hypothetical protein
MSVERSKLARWLPTLLGVGAALTIATLYELGVLGSQPPEPAPEEPCCANTREPAPESEPSLPDRPHPAVEAEREQLVEAVELAKTREQLLAERAVTGEVRYTNLSQAELEAMARNCDVRTDYPIRLEPSDIEDLDLAPEEQAAYDRALVRFAEQETATYRELYRELAPPSVDVNALSNTELRTGLVRSLGRARQAGDEDIRKLIAEERAGLRSAPSDPNSGSVFARYTRARYAAGDRFNAQLEQELGKERTQELRSVFDGWKGARMREFQCEGRPELKE